MAGNDGTKHLFDSKQQKLIFYHEWSESSVEFKPLDLAYSETISNDWEEVQLPRRINRSLTWSGVTRKISLGWSLAAWDLAEAKLNLANCSKMVQMMYPETDVDGKVTGGNPIWHLGLMNLIHSEDVEAAASNTRESLLAGFPTNFNFTVLPEDGFIYDGNKPYPKSIKITLSYTVLLDDSKNFGWSGSPAKWSITAKSFPWSAEPDAQQ